MKPKLAPPIIRPRVIATTKPRNPMLSLINWIRGNKERKFAK